MYKGAHQNKQRRTDAIPVAEIAAATAPENQTPEQERESLLRAMSGIEAQIATCNDKSRRKELGLQKLKYQARVSELNPKCKLNREIQWGARRNIGAYFMDIAKERLPPAQFKAMWLAAERACELARAAAKDEP